MDVVSTNPPNEIAFSFTPPPQVSTTKYESKISPSILLIIFILAIIFFISGILHLLVRFLLRPAAREAEDSDNGTALQGQLQDLFHLHDAGVDQSFIDALPVFLYKAIIGLKDPFDCAVCLSEFEPQDKLRLLPKCSHAFHIECIDTWLLSHSTCPLCRRSLFPDFSPVRNSFSPVVLVLESGSEGSREFLGSSREDPGEVSKSSEVVLKEEDEKVVSVKLGKFRNVDVGEGSSDGNRSIVKGQRRCFSMGSCEYVMDESCVLQVALTSIRKKKANNASNASNLSKRESFSFSKIWLQPRREAAVLGGGGASRRAFSFRSPPHRVLAEDWEKNWESGSEINLDVEAGSCVNSSCSQIEGTPSFARRTLLWIVGRQNRRDLN